MAEEATRTIEVEPAGESNAGSADHTEVPAEERIAGLEAALAERDARLAELEDALSSAQQRISGLERSLAQREARVMELDGSLDEAESGLKERDGEIGAVRSQLARAVALYRSSLLAAEPEIPEDLVQGNTIEEVEASLALARQVVEQVRSQMEARASQERVPFGAPVRSSPDLSALSPQEKIVLGLSRR